MDYEIIWTAGALVALEGNTAEAADTIRAEIDALLADGLGSISKLVFHTVWIGDGDMSRELALVCTPTNDGKGILVEVGQMVSEGKLDAGRYAGYEVIMAQPVPDDDEIN